MLQQPRASPCCLLPGSGFPEYAFGAMTWCSGVLGPSAMQVALEGSARGWGWKRILWSGLSVLRSPCWEFAKLLGNFVGLGQDRGLHVSWARLLFHCLVPAVSRSPCLCLIASPGS